MDNIKLINYNVSLLLLSSLGYKHILGEGSKAVKEKNEFHIPTHENVLSNRDLFIMSIIM